MKWIAFILFAPLLFVGVGVVGFYLAIDDKPVDETAQAYYEALTEAKSSEAGPVFIEMPPIVTNLRQTASGRFIQLALTLRTSQKNQKKAEWLVPHYTEVLHDYLRGLDEHEIEGSAGMRRLKEDLLARAAAIDPDRTIEAVLIRKLIVQ